MSNIADFVSRRLILVILLARYEFPCFYSSLKCLYVIKFCQRVHYTNASDAFIFWVHFYKEKKIMIFFGGGLRPPPRRIQNLGLFFRLGGP